MTMDPQGALEEVRFGLIGCGGIGQWHARCLRGVPGTTLAGVTDTDAAAREKAASTFQVPAFETAEALLRDEAINVVSICTPPSSHAALILAAAAAGKHVLVEKPLALDLAAADGAITACALYDVQLGVVHQQRGRSATRTLRQLLIDGRLGQPLMASAMHSWFRTDAQLDEAGWRGDAAAGGGLLLDQAIHAIDLLVWFLGEPRWVSGSSATLARQTRAEDTAVAIIGFESGAMATLAASTAANALRDDIAIEVAGTRGSCRLEIRDYDHAEIVRLEMADTDERRAWPLPAAEIELLVRRSGGQWRQGPRAWPWRGLGFLAGGERGGLPFRDPRAYLRRQIDRIAQQETGELQGHAAILQDMADAVRGKRPPLIPGREARHALAIIDAIRRSQAAGGLRIELARPRVP